MSYYLFEIDNEIDYNNIIIGKKIKFENTSRYYIYYLDLKPKEMYIRLPSIRIINSYKNNKYNQIKLPIYPSWATNKKFIKFIKYFEKYIINKINIPKTFISCLDNINNINNIKININLDFKIHSNLNTTPITIKDLKLNNEIEGIISVPFVWENEEKYGLSINIKQLKYIYDEIDNDILNKNIETKNLLDNVINEKVIINNDLLEIPTKQIPKFVISPLLLKNAIKKLKKKESTD